MTMVCAEHGIPRKSYSEDALMALQKTDWSGNIRELRNIVERLVILCDNTITGEDVRMFANPRAKA
jgi:DNA-binding NtrC family response regulator